MRYESRVCRQCGNRLPIYDHHYQYIAQKGSNQRDIHAFDAITKGLESLVEAR